MTHKHLTSIVRNILLEQSEGDLNVTRVDPAEPMTTGTGQEVTVRGSGFAEGAAVTLISPKGVRVAAQIVKLVNPGTLTAYVPGLKETGTYRAEVQVGGRKYLLTSGVKVSPQRYDGPT